MTSWMPAKRCTGKHHAVCPELPPLRRGARLVAHPANEIVEAWAMFNRNPHGTKVGVPACLHCSVPRTDVQKWYLSKSYKPSGSLCKRCKIASTMRARKARKARF